ncbi:MAG: hypothetical protein Q8867_10530, partial [Bacteroidota bacterium]|nr:hypothetical protein [Bacteroidota bacterium]
TIEGDEFLMGSIIGLTREDILQLKHSSEQKSEITIRNSDCSFILSGYASDIRRILEEAKKEGALSVKELRVTVPYHSCFLTEAARLFEQKVHEMKFNETKTPIISLIDQKMLQEESSLKAELIRNIFLPLNWIKTQIHLQQLGVTAFIECGPNKSLVKNSRFLPGNAVFLAANNAEKLMAF